MFIVHSLLVELYVAARTFADSNRRRVVEVYDVLFDFSRLVFVAQHYERRMNQTLTVKNILLAFVNSCFLYLLLADLTTEIVLKVLITV